MHCLNNLQQTKIRRETMEGMPHGSNRIVSPEQCVRRLKVRAYKPSNTGDAAMTATVQDRIARKGRNLMVCILVTFGLALAGCVPPPQPLTDRNSQLTQGNVQLSIQVGTTTKAEVLESFGSPNITTRDGQGREVWTYQRSAQVAQSSSQSEYWTVILAGGQSGNSGFESSSRMITLIIKFDSNDVVTDLSSRTSTF